MCACKTYQVLNGMLDLGSPDTSEHLVEHVGAASVADVDVEVVNDDFSADNVEHLELLGGLQEFTEALGSLGGLVVVHLSLESNGNTLASGGDVNGSVVGEAGDGLAVVVPLDILEGDLDVGHFHVHVGVLFLNCKFGRVGNGLELELNLDLVGEQASSTKANAREGVVELSEGVGVTSMKVGKGSIVKVVNNDGNDDGTDLVEELGVYDASALLVGDVLQQLLGVGDELSSCGVLLGSPDQPERRGLVLQHNDK